MPADDITHQIRLLVEAAAIKTGLDSGRACDLASAVEEQFRERFGGELV